MKKGTLLGFLLGFLTATGLYYWLTMDEVSDIDEKTLDDEDDTFIDDDIEKEHF